MLINAQSAQVFIDGYSSLLIEVISLQSPTIEYEDIIHALAAGRKMIAETPTLVDDALTSLKQQKIVIPPEVVSAIRTLQQKRWIYLRDTTKYSIFIDPNEEEAYAVCNGLMKSDSVIGIN